MFYIVHDMQYAFESHNPTEILYLYIVEEAALRKIADMEVNGMFKEATQKERYCTVL